MTIVDLKSLETQVLLAAARRQHEKEELAKLLRDMETWFLSRR